MNRTIVVLFVNWYYAGMSGEATLSLESVHELSTYELRQTCEKNGIPLPEPVNGSTLLQAVISWLVKKQRESERITSEDLEADRKAIRERLAREKAQRKAAALERSRKRREEEEQRAREAAA